MTDRYPDGLAKHPGTTNHQPSKLNKKQFSPPKSDDKEGWFDFAPLTDEEHDEIVHRNDTANQASQRAGQLKRAYHQSQKQPTISQQNKPPAQPRAPRAPAQPRAKRPVDPTVKLKKQVGFLQKLARMSKGH